MILSTFVDQSMNATSFGGKSCTYTRSFHKAFIFCLKHKLRCWGETFCQSHTTKEREVAWRWLEKCITYNKPPKGSKLSIGANRWLEECTIGLISHLRKLLPWYIFNFDIGGVSSNYLIFQISFCKWKKLFMKFQQQI